MTVTGQTGPGKQMLQHRTMILVARLHVAAMQPKQACLTAMQDSALHAVCFGNSGKHCLHQQLGLPKQDQIQS